MPISTNSRAACAARSHATARSERRSELASGRRADEHEAAGTGTDATLHPLLWGSATFHREEQQRHAANAALQQAYGDRLLEPDVAGPALVLAIGALVDEVDLALHLVASGGRVAASGASVGTATACREIESVVGEGPGTSAVMSGAIVLDHTEASLRWPAFTPTAVDLGVRSVIAVPLGPPGAIVGAVTIYSTRSFHVAATTTRLVPVLSDTLLRLLLDDQEAGTTHALGAGSASDCIHVASGMVAARHGCSTDDSLVLLRARAYADDIPLHVLADLIVNQLADLD